MEELPKAITSLSRTGGFLKVLVMVDALDRCDISNGTCSKLLAALYSLQAICNVNVFATSCFIPEITERFKGMPALEFRASKEDIASYPRENLSVLPSFMPRNQNLQEEISTDNFVG